MSKKKRALSGAGTPGRAAETAALTGATFSKNDFTTATVGRQPKITALLSRGAENAVTLRDLVALTGWSGREVRRQIQAERKAGALILSDNSCGYFLPESPDDLKKFYRSMDHRAREIMAAARMAEAAYLEALGQGKIAGW